MWVTLECAGRPNLDYFRMFINLQNWIEFVQSMLRGKVGEECVVYMIIVVLFC